MKKTDFKSCLSSSANKWYITAFACFLFFPLGCLLFAVSLIYERKNFGKNKAIVRSGLCLIIVSLFMLTAFLVYSFSGVETGFIALFYVPGLVSGIIMTATYCFFDLRNKRISRISFLIINEHIITVSEISEIVGISESDTVKLLKKMFENKILDGAYLDGDGKKVCFKKSVRKKEKAVCRSCGAEITVEFGYTLISEYCGGVLDVDIMRKKEN